ncbi:PEBP-like protein [Panaeolus papilionaceus]|nr:PEBP-like protein [Panaeolus papilionaceus]
MRFSSLPFVSLLVAIVAAQDLRVNEVRKAFNDANIPRDLHITFNPRGLLEVTFPQAAGASPITIHAGEQVPRADTAGPPIFNVVGLSPRQRGPFVVATVDPDAPTPQMPTVAQIRHFLGVNFFLEGTRLVNRTAAISDFKQPTPPAGSPAHRYVFLLFDQPPNFAQQTEVTSTTSILSFNISAFASEVGLGNPLAGTFMLVAPPS